MVPPSILCNKGKDMKKLIAEVYEIVIVLRDIL